VFTHVSAKDKISFVYGHLFVANEIVRTNKFRTNDMCRSYFVLLLWIRITNVSECIRSVRTKLQFELNASSFTLACFNIFVTVHTKYA